MDYMLFLVIFMTIMTLSRNIALALITLSVCSCRGRETLSFLKDIENTIQEEPVKSYTTLRKIDRARLETAQE